MWKSIIFSAITSFHAAVDRSHSPQHIHSKSKDLSLPLSLYISSEFVCGGLFSFHFISIRFQVNNIRTHRWKAHETNMFHSLFDELNIENKQHHFDFENAKITFDNRDVWHHAFAQFYWLVMSIVCISEFWTSSSAKKCLWNLLHRRFLYHFECKLSKCFSSDSLFCEPPLKWNFIWLD